jgi:hypothetical protein
MSGAKGGEHLRGRYSARGIIFHRVMHGDHFLFEPAFHRGVTLLQGPQSGAHDLAARRIGA